MDGCSDVVCEILYYWPNCEPCSGSSHILKLGLIQRSMRGETLLYHMAFPRIIKTYSVNLDAYQALNQGGWKHSASDTCTSCTQDSNSLEGHGQGWAGQNGAWGSDCEATWADEIGQFHGDCYLARICIDPCDLNRAILREHVLLKTVKEVEEVCLESRFSAN